jgi:hypothetical protein
MIIKKRCCVVELCVCVVVFGHSVRRIVRPTTNHVQHINTQLPLLYTATNDNRPKKQEYFFVRSLFRLKKKKIIQKFY